MITYSDYCNIRTGISRSIYIYGTISHTGISRSMYTVEIVEHETMGPKYFCVLKEFRVKRQLSMMMATLRVSRKNAYLTLEANR